MASRQTLNRQLDQIIERVRQNAPQQVSNLEDTRQLCTELAYCIVALGFTGPTQQDILLARGGKIVRVLERVLSELGMHLGSKRVLPSGGREVN